MKAKTQKKAKEMLGRITTPEELGMFKFVVVRLVFEMPTIQTENPTMQEKQIYMQWKRQGLVTKDDQVTKEFWTAINEILYQEYGNTF